MQFYEVAFYGDLAPDFEQSLVQQNLASLFKTNANKIAQMFSGNKFTIKTKIDATTAEKYRLAMLKAGAIAHVISLDAVNFPDVEELEQSLESVSPVPPEREEVYTQTANLRTAPPGLANPHHVGEDTTNLSPLNVTPKDGYSAAFAHVKAPDFGIDETGAILQIPADHQAPNVDLSRFSLNKLGTKLDQKVKDEATSIPDISHLKILK